MDAMLDYEQPFELRNVEADEADEAFCEAMLAAWREGLENPPMIGVDTRPCTRNPKFVPHRKTSHIPMQSIGGELLARGE